MKLTNVLSLFDGMSCGQIALNRQGIEYENYFASEIDKYAIQVTKHNYPDTIVLGDVKNINSIVLPKIDLLMGGSPCQSFSFAGKMKGMSTKDNIEIISLDQYLDLKEKNFEFQGQSYLFWEYVRILKETKPTYFLLENVLMKKKWKDIISETLEVEPIEINSALVSAQNRRRLYWTNIPGIQLPENKNITLKDIVEDGAIDLRMTTNEKAFALTATYSGAVAWNSVDRKQRTMILDAINGKKVSIDLLLDAPFTFYETRTEEGKLARKKIKEETGRDSTPRSKEFKMYLPNQTGKANCLVTVDNPLDYIIDPTWKYRKLYPTECEALQTVPNGYTKVVSPTQARKMIGNGWTIDVISHIFSYIN